MERTLVPLLVLTVNEPAGWGGQFVVVVVRGLIDRYKNRKGTKLC